MASVVTNYTIFPRVSQSFGAVACALGALLLFGCEGTEIIADLKTETGLDGASVDDGANADDLEGDNSGDAWSDTGETTEENILACGAESRSGDIWVDSMADLSDLYMVSHVKGDLIIKGETKDTIYHLSDLQFLLCIDGDLIIEDNHNLDSGSLWGLASLSSIKGNIDIVDNDTLPTCEAIYFVNEMRNRNFTGKPCIIYNFYDGCSDYRYQDGCQFI